MSYLERLRAENASTHAAQEPIKPTKAPSIGFDGSSPGRFHGLTDDVAAGLRRLRLKPAPRISRPEVWPEIVADALRLASEGWAERALALGWGPLELWGCSPEIGGNVDQEGLAVRLCGRKIIMLDGRSAIIDDGSRYRRQFNRRPMDGAVFLWDLGRCGIE